MKSFRFIPWLVVLAVSLPGAAMADPPTRWDRADAGTISVPGVGEVSFSARYADIGYDHFWALIEISWLSDGERLTQELYSGALDDPPVEFVGLDRGIDLRMEFCPRGNDDCQTESLLFSYDSQSRIFSEVE